MLVDRDAAITTFKKEKYYHVRLALSGAEAASERISNKAEADTLKNDLRSVKSSLYFPCEREKDRSPAEAL